MKDTSPNADKIISEYWESPIVDSQHLWLNRQLFTGLNNYFFFNKDTDRVNDPIYVLTIPCRDTFKISNESDSLTRIMELLKNKKPSARKKGRSFKVWDSPLALEHCRGLAISTQEYEHMEKYQYIILTEDEAIEFVTFSVPRWEVHKNILLDDLVIQYLKNDPLD